MDLKNSNFQHEKNLYKRGFHNYMSAFIDHRYFLKDYCQVIENDHIIIDSIPTLLGFASFLKFQLSGNILNGHQNENRTDIFRKCELFVRGDNDRYDNLIPSLFRKIEKNKHEVAKEWILAHREFCSALRNKIYPNNQRFSVDEFGSVLQHYSFNTPWLDVVDNIYNAIWFASHEFGKNTGTYFVSDNLEYGWLTFIATKDKMGNELEYKNLRNEYTSFSLRFAAQHGYSVMNPIFLEKNKDLTIQNINELYLDNFMVARVKFPIREFCINGQFFSASNLFPSSKYDHTAFLFEQKGDIIQNICEKIELEHKLENESLGRYQKIS